MAEFEKSYKRTGGIEGGYVNRADDPGGETFGGVSRVYHPKWPGWKMVEEYKLKYPPINKENIKQLNKALFANQDMQKMLYSFYLAEFWNINRLSEINNQWLADNVYDASVNCGPSMGPRFLQKAINELQFDSLSVDGVVGKKTLSAANSVDAKTLTNKLIDIRKEWHKVHSSKANLKGLLNRCELMRKVD
jgi:lysozyme family protein